jgi:molybdopterin-binding protein
MSIDRPCTTCVRIGQAADELGLVADALVMAVAKATDVLVELEDVPGSGS